MSSITLFTPLGGGELNVRNAAIVEATRQMDGGARVKDLTPVAPMAVERLVTAQMNHYADNDQNVRARTLFHATPIGLGLVLTVAARVIRVAVRTVFIPVSLAVAAFEQSRYGQMADAAGEKILKYNLVAEDLRRIGQEFVDLAHSLFTVPVVGTINTIAPGAISTEFLFTQYRARVKKNVESNAQFEAARAAYLANQEQKHDSWVRAQSHVTGYRA